MRISILILMQKWIMNDDDVNILAAGGARYVAGPSEMGGTVIWGTNSTGGNRTPSNLC